MRRKLEACSRAATGAATALLVFALLWAPSITHACSQCLATRTRANQLAFIWTTVFLSITPLLVVGGIVLWLRKKIREADAQQLRAEGPRSDELRGLPRPAAIR